LLARGRAVREALKQPLYDPLPAAEQVAILLAATGGVFDQVPPEFIAKASRDIRDFLRAEMPGFYNEIESGQLLTDADGEKILQLAGKAVAAVWKPSKP